MIVTESTHVPTLTLEAAPKPLFGQLKLADLRANPDLTRKVMPLVKEACDHSKGRFTVDNVADGLLTGECRLWCVMRAAAPLAPLGAAVTRVRNGVFEILAIGPDFNEVVGFIPRMTESARAQGCVKMSLTGQKWWTRKLPQGWRSVAVVMEHALTAPASEPPPLDVPAHASTR